MKTVANEIVVFESGFGGIKDLHQHDNDMGPLHQHHTERGSAREALWWHRRPREVNKNEITCMFYEVRQKVSVKMFIYHKIFYA